MTPDEAAFLKAITDNPADETARLVYADWLSDHDDPRAAFARLAADFLRCIRDLADMRRAIPVEWLEVMDPLFNRVRVFTLPLLGEGVVACAVNEVHITAGSRVPRGFDLFEIETEKAMISIPSQCECLVCSVLVRSRDGVSIGQPLFTYLEL
jgi:uncharacterized protein (TIGR02996 family)